MLKPSGQRLLGNTGKGVTGDGGEVRWALQTVPRMEELTVGAVRKREGRPREALSSPASSNWSLLRVAVTFSERVL